MIIIDDASTDGSRNIYKSYLRFYKIDPDRYKFIINRKKSTALSNIYLNAIKHCSFDDVVVTVDADDELLGRNVLKLLNWAYVGKKAGVVYSNFYQYSQGEEVSKGYSEEYDST